MSVIATLTRRTKAQMRYDTMGDWLGSPTGVLSIVVQETGKPDYDFLIALHELVEGYLCQKHGITQEKVDAFDLAWKGHGEPGDSPKAPYHREHKAATAIEKLMAKFLGVKWAEYDRSLSE